MNFRPVKNKALIFSITASGLWHLLFISVVAVVIIPESVEVVKFSKVSFLGPVASVGALELRSELREKTFLEKRFSGYADSFPISADVSETEDFNRDFYRMREGEFYKMAVRSFGERKSSPPPAEE